MNTQDIIQKYDLDIDSFIAKAERVSKVYADLDARLQSAGKSNPLAAMAAKQQNANQTLGQQVQVYQRVEAAANSYRAEQKRIAAEYVNLNARQKEFTDAAKYGQTKSQLEAVEGKLKALNVPLKETDSLWDKIKAKFSAGLKVPAINMPSSGSSASKGSGGSLKDAGSALLDEVGGAVGLGSGTLTVAGAVGAAGAVIVKSTKEWAEYGKALSEVSSITGAVGKDLQFLDEQAQQIEADTGISATRVVQAFQAIGSIKPELLANKEALAGVTKEVIALGQATPQLNLDDVAKALLGSLNQFNEGADQAARFSNVLAAGALAGSSEVNDTAEALKNSGTAMKAAGLSFEQGNALIQILAKGMIKGSEAGTSLRNVLLKLETDTDKNVRPSVVGLDKALENAAKKFDSTTALTKEFGAENIIAAKQVLSARTEVTEMTKAITGTQTAYEQARTNTDNLATDLAKSGTNISAFFRGLGQSQDGYLRLTIQSFNNFLTSLNSKTGSVRAFFSGFKEELIKGAATGNFLGGASAGIQRGIKDAYDQAQANKLAAARKADQDKTIADAQKGVATQTSVYEQEYQKQGETVPKAQKAAAEKIQAEREKARVEAVQAHQKLRVDFEKADADDKAAYAKQFEASRKRVLSATAATKTANDNVARINKQAAEQAEALRKAQGEPETDAQKKAGEKAQKIEDDNNRLLLEAQKDYQKEVLKLEQEYGKERLESLKKDSAEYINAKANYEQDLLKVQRDSIEKQLQLAKSNKTAVVNGRREVVADKSVTLENSAPEVARIFAERQQQIETERARQLELSRVRQEYQLLELAKQSTETELAIFDKYWEEKLLTEKDNSAKLAELQSERDAARKIVAAKESKADLVAFDKAWAEIIANETKNGAVYNALIAKRNRDRAALVSEQILTTTKRQEDISLAFVDTDQYAKIQQTVDPSMNAEDLERNRQKARLTIQIQAGKDRIKLLKEQGEAENALLITQAQAAVDGLTEQQDRLTKNTPKYTDIYDLLGITNGLDASQLDQFRQAMQTIGSSIREATAAIVEQSEAKLQAIQNEIQAKEDQLKIEEERDKEGLANNKDRIREELDALKAQKAEEQEVKKRALAVQQGLDILSITSTNAVTAANLIASAAASFRSAAESSFNPILGVIQAIAAIAIIFATFATVRAKVSSLNSATKLRKGGRIPLTGRSHEQGGHRIEGTDFEVERGEHFINADDSDRYDKTLQALNKNNPMLALQNLIREGKLSMPAAFIEHAQRPGGGVVINQAAVDLSPLQNDIASLRDELQAIRNNTKPGKQRTALGDGWVLEQEGNRETVRKVKTP